MPIDQTAVDIDLPPGFVAARIAARKDIAADVVQLDLERANGGATRAAEPGAHLELFIPIGDGGEVRQYSLCGDDPWQWRIAALRGPLGGRGGSAWLHDRAEPGTIIGVRGPRSTFRFQPTGPVLLIAGGIGITPLLSMAAAAQASGVDWRLIHIGRSRQAMAFAGTTSLPAEHIDLWPADERGRADLDQVIAHAAPGTTVYACGPDRMLDALQAASRSADLRLVVERFAPAGSTDDAPPSGSSTDHPFVVELADATEVDVPLGVSVLDALRDAGIRTLSSCRRGECGTCETPVIDGEVDHRDQVLSEEERAANEVMMICISRARGDRLVLDI